MAMQKVFIEGCGEFYVVTLGKKTLLISHKNIFLYKNQTSEVNNHIIMVVVLFFCVVYHKNHNVNIVIRNPFTYSSNQHIIHMVINNNQGGIKQILSAIMCTR